MNQQGVEILTVKKHGTETMENKWQSLHQYVVLAAECDMESLQK